MKFLKLFSLAIILAMFGGFLLSNSVQAQETEELANALAEFEADEVTAKDLEVEEPTVLPGETGYGWQIFKENVGLFFTFNNEKKVEKLEQISNRRLIEIKKLSEKTDGDASAKIEQALERYRNVMQKVTNRLEKNENLKEKILEKIDAKQLKHQEVLLEVGEKLKNKLPEEKLDRIKKVREENSRRLYNLNKEKFQERLENAVEKVNVGQSKFNTLRVLPALEAIQESVTDEEAQGKIDAVKIKAEAILSERLQNMSSDDKEKLDKYIHNVKAPELVKQKVVDTLQNSAQLPTAAKEQIKATAKSYAERTLERFRTMNQAQKEKFLNQFENVSRSHPAYLDFLNKVDDPNLQERVRKLKQLQEEGIKEKLQKTDNIQKLNSFENNSSIKANPALLKTLRDKQQQIKYQPKQVRPAPSPSPATDLRR